VSCVESTDWSLTGIHTISRKNAPYNKYNTT